MEYLDYPFAVSTGSSRRPTPTEFEHLRQWLDKDERFLLLHSQSDITNIDQQLDQTTKIMVSNVIQRVIAQIIGDKDPGFVTIKGTDGGALHVYPAGGAEGGKIDAKIADGDSAALGAIADAIVAAGAAGTISAKLRRLTQGLEDLKTLVVLAAGDKLIGNVKIAGTTRTLQKAVIDFAGGGDSSIIGATALVKIHITSLVFTVGGTTNITLITGSTDISGPMDFGGTNEPRGMVANHGEFALQCGTNEAFIINSSAAVQVSGYVIYFKE